MQPTQEQVRRSMQALRSERPSPEATPSDPTVPDEAFDCMAQLPTVRADRVAQALEWMASGAELTSEELAEKVVGRLVCDRLR